MYFPFLSVSWLVKNDILLPILFFPEGKVYNKCAKWGLKFWCGFQYEFKNNEWGFCDPSVCPTGAGRFVSYKIKLFSNYKYIYGILYCVGL